MIITIYHAFAFREKENFFEIILDNICFVKVLRYKRQDKRHKIEYQYIIVILVYSLRPMNTSNIEETLKLAE